MESFLEDEGMTWKCSWRKITRINSTFLRWNVLQTSCKLLLGTVKLKKVEKRIHHSLNNLHWLLIFVLEKGLCRITEVKESQLRVLPLVKVWPFVSSFLPPSPIKWVSNGSHCMEFPWHLDQQDRWHFHAPKMCPEGTGEMFASLLLCNKSGKKISPWQCRWGWKHFNDESPVQQCGMWAGWGRGIFLLSGACATVWVLQVLGVQREGSKHSPAWPSHLLMDAFLCIYSFIYFLFLCMCMLIYVYQTSVFFLPLNSCSAWTLFLPPAYLLLLPHKPLILNPLQSTPDQHLFPTRSCLNGLSLVRPSHARPPLPAHPALPKSLHILWQRHRLGSPLFTRWPASDLCAAHNVVDGWFWVF